MLSLASTDIKYHKTKERKTESTAARKIEQEKQMGSNHEEQAKTWDFTLLTQEYGKNIKRKKSRQQPPRRKQHWRGRRQKGEKNPHSELSHFQSVRAEKSKEEETKKHK